MRKLKFVSKMIAYRFKDVLHHTIVESQIAFLHEKQILDVFLIANEVVDYTARKRRAQSTSLRHMTTLVGISWILFFLRKVLE